MTELLIRLFVGKNASADDPRTRTSYGVLSGFVGIAVNVILTAAKFAVGSLTGSISITADAINNLSDAGSSVVTLVGFKMAKARRQGASLRARQNRIHIRADSVLPRPFDGR